MPASSLCYNVGMDTKIIVGAALAAVLALSAFAAPVKANVRELTVK